MFLAIPLMLSSHILPFVSNLTPFTMSRHTHIHHCPNSAYIEHTAVHNYYGDHYGDSSQNYHDHEPTYLPIPPPHLEPIPLTLSNVRTIPASKPPLHPPNCPYQPSTKQTNLPRFPQPPTYPSPPARPRHDHDGRISCPCLSCVCRPSHSPSRPSHSQRHRKRADPDYPKPRRAPHHGGSSSSGGDSDADSDSDCSLCCVYCPWYRGQAQATRRRQSPGPCHSHGRGRGQRQRQRQSQQQNQRQSQSQSQSQTQTQTQSQTQCQSQSQTQTQSQSQEQARRPPSAATAAQRHCSEHHHAPVPVQSVHRHAYGPPIPLIVMEQGHGTNRCCLYQ